MVQPIIGSYLDFFFFWYFVGGINIFNFMSPSVFHFSSGRLLFLNSKNIRL